MWLLGLLVGAVVGGLLGHGSGALAGAIVGTVAGAVYRSRHGGQAQDEKSAARRLAELERLHQERPGHGRAADQLDDDIHLRIGNVAVKQYAQGM